MTTIAISFFAAEEVSKKFANLRTYYKKEQDKLGKEKSGSGAADVLRTSAWVHFDALKFLVSAHKSQQGLISTKTLLSR